MVGLAGGVGHTGYLVRGRFIDEGLARWVFLVVLGVAVTLLKDKRKFLLYFVALVSYSFINLRNIFE